MLTEKKYGIHYLSNDVIVIVDLDAQVLEGEYYFYKNQVTKRQEVFRCSDKTLFKKVIASNVERYKLPFIDINQLQKPDNIDAVLKDKLEFVHDTVRSKEFDQGFICGGLEGYIEAQGKFGFSKDDMIKAVTWATLNHHIDTIMIKEYVKKFLLPKFVWLEVDEEDYHYVSGGLKPVGEIGGKGLTFMDGTNITLKLQDKEGGKYVNILKFTT